LSWHGVVTAPLLWLLSRADAFSFERASILYEGMAAPKDACSESSLHQATDYRPRSEDVFVATQMKCGTTWMQHLVYQIVTRGRGDLVETGRALYAISPWIESVKSVSMEESPLVGEEPRRRIVKTHLPAALCPYSCEARYIYVVRHPVSCFASCVDFIRTNLGPFQVSLDEFERWYCTDKQMWFGSWPAHVLGWWQRSRQQENVVFVRFEDMKSDLARVARQIAEFLGVAGLSNAEMSQILHKCSFEYMSENSEAFEMNVPSVLQTRAAMFVSGEADRHQDVPEDARRRIADWCRRSLEGFEVSLSELYPDIASTT
jgi:hypothetical protein